MAGKTLMEMPGERGRAGAFDGGLVNGGIADEGGEFEGCEVGNGQEMTRISWGRSGSGVAARRGFE